MRMTDWKEKLDAFLRFNEYEMLDNPGKVSKEIADSFAISEFEKYKVIQDRIYKSDFDLLLTEDIIKTNKNKK